MSAAVPSLTVRTALLAALLGGTAACDEAPSGPGPAPAPSTLTVVGANGAPPSARLASLAVGEVAVVNEPTLVGSPSSVIIGMYALRRPLHAREGDDGVPLIARPAARNAAASRV